MTQSSSPFFAPDAFFCVAQTMAAAGLSVRSYSVDVPSFGPWGFHLAAAGGPAPYPSGLHLAVPTRFLTDAVARNLFDLPGYSPPPPDIRPNKLLDPRAGSLPPRPPLGGVRLMLGLLIAGSILVLAGAGVLAWLRATPERALPPISEAPRSVFSLRVGDIVQHTGTDYTVDSTIRYEEEGMTWQAHLLGGGERDSWLVVEEDDRVVITLVEEVDAADESSPPRSSRRRSGSSSAA